MGSQISSAMGLQWTLLGFSVQAPCCYLERFVRNHFLVWNAVWLELNLTKVYFRLLHNRDTQKLSQPRNPTSPLSTSLSLSLPLIETQINTNKFVPLTHLTTFSGHPAVHSLSIFAPANHQSHCLLKIFNVLKRKVTLNYS